MLLRPVRWWAVVGWTWQKTGGEYIGWVFRRLVQGLSQRLPSQCLVCHRWPTFALCHDCVATFGQPRNRCTRCALALPEPQTVCGACLLQPPPLDACLCAVDYSYPWSELVAGLKFHGECSWAWVLARLMRAAHGVESALDNADAVIALPLSPQRLRMRGYNQALELARALDARKVDTDVLLRTLEGPPQHSLPREVRLRAVQQAFAVDPLRSARVRGRRLLLVDDVMTTGASLHAAARTLREAGAAEITALVFARTPT